jgi:hypothetical protein
MTFGTQSREGLVFSAYAVYAVRPDDARSAVRQLHGGVDVVLVLTWKFEVGKALVQQWWEL